ncbi:unnamed protein product [Musa banksii]
MALANGRIPQGWSSSHALIHGGWAASPQLSLNELFEGYPIYSFSSSHALGVANPCSLQEALSVVDFRVAPGGWCGSNSSLLDFEQGDGVTWAGIADSWLADGRIYSEMMSAYGSIGSPVREVEIQKRSRSMPITQEGDVPSPKKRCGNARTIKEKSSPSKDPQTLAAKAERISKRLKTLQDLVPNGAKACILSNSLATFDSANHILIVDMVTMLEKAINYVKFLQLQVKVLATDEFWPAQGGKAPDTAQVKEAIDAILSSHRDRDCSSNQ